MRRFLPLALMIPCLCLSPALAEDDDGCLAALASGRDASTCAGLDQLLLDRFRRPERLDRTEAVIRVYGEDGEGYELRRLRFDTLPRDYVLAMRRREEQSSRARVRALWTHDSELRSRVGDPAFDPRVYVPVAALPYVNLPGGCE